MEDMRAALQALLFETRPFFFDEAALADSAAKGRADYVTRCDTGVQRFLQTSLRGAGRTYSSSARRARAARWTRRGACSCWTRWTARPI